MQMSFLATDEPGEQISGLACLPSFIDGPEEKRLLNIIDGLPWLDDLRRRVQHYGYKYDYKARTLSQNLYLGPLPDWLAGYADRVRDEGIFRQHPDQVIVNEYQPGQGIAPHVDCIPCFGETIASLSLGSPCVMDFARAGRKGSLLLESCSMLVLSGEARYQWTHAIAPRKTDTFNGQIIPRGRRVSMTFRKVRTDYAP